MSLPVVITAQGGNTSGPFPPNYLVAWGYYAPDSTPDGDNAGTATPSTYYGSNILAIANETDTNPKQLLIAMEGLYDQTYLGDVTYPVSGNTYLSANASFEQTTVNGYSVTLWIWQLAEGESALANGTITIGDTGDAFLTLTGRAPNSSQIVLDWTNSLASPLPTSYLLYRGVSGATPTLYQTFTGSSTLEYIDTSLSASTQYSYYVVATYADGTLLTTATQVLFTPATGISDAFNCDCDAQALPGARTLADLRKSILIRGGYAAAAANPPPGMKDLVDEFLRDAQRQLYRQHDELQTKRLYAWQMEINQRYYGITEDMSDCRFIDPLKIEWVGFEDLNQAWYPLIKGIDPVLYTRAQISTGWPTHYEIRSCIEIFPAPRAPYTLWIKGHFGLDSFTEDSDVTTIDSEAVFLLALAMFKAHYGQRDAQTIFTQAGNYVKYLVAGQHLSGRYVPRTRVQTPMTPPRFLPVEE